MIGPDGRAGAPVQTEGTHPAGSIGILVDARCVRDGASGVGHYVAGLLRGIDAELDAQPGHPRVAAMRLARGVGAFAGLWEGLRHVRVIDVEADYQDHPAGDAFLNLGIGRVLQGARAQVLVSPFFVAPAGPRSFARVVGILDDLPWSEPGNYPAGFRAYIKAQAALTLPFAERAFTLSRASARALKGHLGPLLRTRLERVPGAVDTALFRPASAMERLRLKQDLGVPGQPPLAVFVASHERRKNHAMLVRAMRPLAGRVQLALIGRASGPQRRALQALAGGLRITFHEPSSHAGVAAWTRAADIALFPSLNEGFGLPPLEAMAAGVPLIASDIGAVREVTGRCATLVPPDDPAAWTAAVRGVLHSPPVESWLEKGIARARSFTWQSSARVLLRLSLEAAAARRR